MSAPVDREQEVKDAEAMAKLLLGANGAMADRGVLADMLKRYAARLTPPTPEPWEAVKRLCEAATPGPWEFCEQHGRDIVDEGWSEMHVESPVRGTHQVSEQDDQELEGNRECNRAKNTMGCS